MSSNTFMAQLRLTRSTLTGRNTLMDVRNAVSINSGATQMDLILKTPSPLGEVNGSLFLSATDEFDMEITVGASTVTLRINKLFASFVKADNVVLKPVLQKYPNLIIVKS